MDHEGLFLEVSEDKLEVGQQGEVVGVVAPMPIEIPLEVQVAPPADNTQSPSPSSPTPLPEMPSPPPSPVGDLPSFMGFYTTYDVTNLEQSAVDSGIARNSPELRVEEPDISRIMKVFFRVTLGAEW